MSDMNSDFLNEVCEAIYGDEFTKHDKRNVLRNLKPALDGKGVLKFGTILHSTHFLEYVIELWEQKQSLYDQRRRYKKEMKTDKDYQFVCDQLQKERDICDEKIKEEYLKCKEIEQGHIEKSDIYNKLKYDYKELQYNVNNLLKKQECVDNLREQVTNLTIDKSDAEVKYKKMYKDMYDKKKEQLDKEIDVWKKEYVRQDDKIIFMEKNNTIKMLKEEIKELKKKHKNLINLMTD